MYACRQQVDIIMMDMNMMSLVQELMGMMIILVTKPIYICKWAFLLGMRITFLVVHTWVELVKASISFHLDLIWRTIVCFVAVVSLPFRVLTALQRESLLEENLCEMQLELENLVWDRKILEDHLQAAIRERKILESMFAELEDEHDKAIEKIELLERELQDLKDETVQLKEICGKELWSFAGHDRNNEKKGFVADEYGIPYGIPSWKGSDIILRDMMKHKDTCENENKSNAELLTHLGTGLAPGTIPRNLDMNEVYNQRKAVAISQSLFSAVLSLLVGMTIWEAQDPCMPLVVALFTVVGMSLRSVIQLFSTIKNKPASDAVALLSFNWFILGTLTYPTLPKVARVLAPWALRFICRTMNWFGISLH
ncbi:uncharacterized protein LOC102615009 isoform X2 [Citrus sinensis]|uniref:uncharacterized protein LOC102615009 isoform X2 n=1 Tax=Citrus sinensis TaxID=2711 RepID=UPI0022787C8C|nr:uncharacterized protein LOC102615009 isoform X2 [Citrus sinensis]